MCRHGYQRRSIIRLLSDTVRQNAILIKTKKVNRHDQSKSWILHNQMRSVTISPNSTLLYSVILTQDACLSSDSKRCAENVNIIQCVNHVMLEQAGASKLVPSLGRINVERFTSFFIEQRLGVIIDQSLLLTLFRALSNNARELQRLCLV